MVLRIAVICILHAALLSFLLSQIVCIIFYAVQVCYIEARGLYTEDAVNLCMLCSCFLKQLFYFSVTFLPFFCLSYCLLVS